MTLPTPRRRPEVRPPPDDREDPDRPGRRRRGLRSLAGPGTRHPTGHPPHDPAPHRSIAGAERAEHERRARVRDHGASDRLDHIADELAALRGDLATFTKAQDAVNADFRAHVVRASVLGDLHTGDAEMFKREQDGHDVRLRAVEDWRVEMRTYGQILRLTFGASVLGLLIGLVGLINMVATFGR